MSASSVRRAVIPAAGLGTRFLPVTKAQPKEMLPLLDKPTIQYGVEECVASGIEQVFMVTGSGKRAILEHFLPAKDLEAYLEERGKDDLLEILREVDVLTEKVDIAYVQQRQPRGLGHAVWTARHLVGGEACGVLLPDDVIVADPPCLKQLMAVHAKTGASVLLVRRVAPDQVGRFGIVATGECTGNVHEVVDLVEKPDPADAPSNLAILGRYVLAAGVFGELERTQPGAGNEIQLTDAIKATIAGAGVVAVEMDCDYYDTGTIPGYLKANLSLGLKQEGLREQLLAVIREFVDAGELGG